MSDSTDVRIGPSAVMYLNTGSTGSPTWSPLTCISDCSLSPKWSEGDAATRGSRVNFKVKTMLDLEIKAKLQAGGGGDANYAAVKAALFTDAALDLMILDASSSTNGAGGVRGDFQVFGADQDQGLTVGAIADDISFKPTKTANPFSSVLVTSGAPVFTNL